MLAYFLTLSSEAHSDAWTPVLLLLFTQMERLQVQRWKAKVQFLNACRRRGWEDLLRLSILSCASFGVLISDQRYSMLTNCHCQRCSYKNMTANLKDAHIQRTWVKGRKCHCRAQVCSVLRSLFLRVGAVYGISNLTNGVDHHGEVGVVVEYRQQFEFSILGGNCGLLMQRR